MARGRPMKRTGPRRYGPGDRRPGPRPKPPGPVRPTLASLSVGDALVPFMKVTLWSGDEFIPLPMYGLVEVIGIKETGELTVRLIVGPPEHYGRFFTASLVGLTWPIEKFEDDHPVRALWPRAEFHVKRSD